MSPVKKTIFQVVALAMSILVLSYLTFWSIGTWELRVTFYSLGLIAAFLYYSEGCRSEEVAIPAEDADRGIKPAKWVIPPLDIALIMLVIMAWIYTMLSGVALIQRAGVFPTTGDVIVGTMFVALSIELGRRTTGWILPVIAFMLVIYGLFGQYFPGLLYHTGISYSRLVSNLYSQQGIFGEILGIVPTYVFVFVTLGAFLEYSKAGNFLVSIAEAMVGRTIGGPAKACVVASSLMGTITGSTVSNVMTVGTFTIPLMKRSGVSSTVAAAIEAVSGTGGQIMPPVMGAAAFVLAENLAMPYNKVALAGFIPAIFYYVSLFLQIHLYSLARHIKGSGSGIRLWDLLRSKGYLLAGIIVLVVLLFVVQISPVRAGLWAILVTLVVSWVSRDTRMGVKVTIEALIKGSQGLLAMIGICAVAGMVVQLLDVTGLALLLTNAIMNLVAGNIWLSLLFIALITLILGMGMPTVPAYILAAVVGTPVLIKMGVQPFVAHFFVFYYACMSSITPPIALGAYAASSIAGSDPWITGWQAVRLGIVGLLVPVALVFQPPLLLVGNAAQTIVAVGFSACGVICLALALEGFLFGRLNSILRILLFISGLVLFVASSMQLNTIALLIALACAGFNFIMNKKCGKRLAG